MNDENQNNNNPTTPTPIAPATAAELVKRHLVENSAIASRAKTVLASQLEMIEKKLSNPSLDVYQRSELMTILVNVVKELNKGSFDSARLLIGLGGGSKDPVPDSIPSEADVMAEILHGVPFANHQERTRREMTRTWQPPRAKDPTTGRFVRAGATPVPEPDSTMIDPVEDPEGENMP